MTLIETIKQSRKIFGKKEIIIIEKQLKGIKLTQSEKNRLSRDIRKKLEEVNALSNYTEQFKLKKGTETNKKIENIKEIILKDELKSKIKKIILFGSYIENQLTFHSDIDIAVEFNNMGKKEASKFRIRILGQCPKNTDVQVYNILPRKMQKEILRGKTIYSADVKDN